VDKALLDSAELVAQPIRQAAPKLGVGANLVGDIIDDGAGQDAGEINHGSPPLRRAPGGTSEARLRTPSLDVTSAQARASTISTWMTDFVPEMPRGGALFLLIFLGGFVP
jgi:hypothetical protein